MANPQPEYFYAPTWDFPPDGPIKLGKVLTSVKRPERPLARLPTEGQQVFPTVKKRVRYTKEKLRGGRFSILTKFLSVLGLGIDVGAETEKRDEAIFEFDTLETLQFVPRASYIEDCVNDPTVRRFLKDSRFRKPVYVITGIKTVQGSRAKTIKSRSHGGKLSAQVDATIWSGGAVPIGGGLGVEASETDSQGTSWEESSDFVFAFRVSRVYAGEKENREDIYRKGALLDSDGARTDDRLVVKTEELGSNNVRRNRDLVDFDIEQLMEDDEVVVCAVPKED